MTTTKIHEGKLDYTSNTDYAKNKLHNEISLHIH